MKTRGRRAVAEATEGSSPQKLELRKVGWTIAIDSKRGRGATFVVTIPNADDNRAS